MPDVNWLSLVMFMALVLSVSLYGLTVSGHFPSEHRSERLRHGRGRRNPLAVDGSFGCGFSLCGRLCSPDLTVVCSRHRRRFGAAYSAATAAAIA